MGSPHRSPLHAAENPPAPPPENRASPAAIPALAASRMLRQELALVSRLEQGSPPHDVENPPAPREKPASPAALPPPATSWMPLEDMAAMSKLEKSGGGGTGVETRDVGEKKSRVVEGIVRRDRTAEVLRRAAGGARIAAVILSLISFSVMASDKTEGWAGDSFDRYQEYRYCVAMNVIVFVYSGFQTYAQLHRTIMKRQIIRRPFRDYFDFTADQILAYLLMSASSSAATRNNDWVSTFGSDGFTHRIDASVAMSFLVFIVLAFSSLISAHNLFSRTYDH